MKVALTRLPPLDQYKSSKKTWVETLVLHELQEVRVAQVGRVHDVCGCVQDRLDAERLDDEPAW